LRVFCGNDLSSFVVSAIGAHVVQFNGIAAVRARSECYRSGAVMRAAFVAASFRVSALWIWHLKTYLKIKKMYFKEKSAQKN
jgi:hypothetical protein